MYKKYKSDFLAIKEIPQENKELFLKRTEQYKYIMTINNIPMLIKDDKQLVDKYKEFNMHKIIIFNTYDRYCKFKTDISEDKKLVWKKDTEYKVAYENDEDYFFGSPLINGISKKYKDDLFTVIDK